MNIKYRHPADLICETMARLYYRGLTTITGGNVSIRDEIGDTWMSPTRLDKGQLRRDQICHFIKATQTMEGPFKPSIENRFHMGIMDNNAEVNAVVHAHIPNGTIFAALDNYPDVNLWHDAKETLTNQFGRAAFFMPGSDELQAEVIREAKAGKTAIFMNNHGVVCGGTDIYDAYKKMEMVEKLSTMDLIAKQLGGHKTIKGDLVSYKADIEVRPAEAPSTIENIQRNELAHYIPRAYNKRFVDCGWCSCSVKIDEHSFLITPENCDNKEISLEELVVIKDGIAYGGKPDGNWKVHETFYKKNPDAGSLFLTTPVYTMAWACSNSDMNYGIYMGLFKLGINRLPYETSIEELTDKLSLKENVAIVENRFVAVCGPNASRAFNTLESIEDFAIAEARAFNYGKYNVIEE